MTAPEGGAPRPAGEPGASRSGWLWILLALVVAVVLGTIASRTFYGDRPARVHTLSGQSMGTTWTLKLALPAGAPAEWVGAIGDTVQARLALVDSLMSTWDPGSELSRFNGLQSLEPQQTAKISFAWYKCSNQQDVYRKPGTATH